MSTPGTTAMRSAAALFLAVAQTPVWSAAARGQTKPAPAVPAPRFETPPTPRVHVSRIVVEGNVAVPDAVLDEIKRPYLGHDLTGDDLEDLRRKLTLSYVSRGFITSGAVLPTQTIDHGTVTYRIIEGRLDDIIVSGTKWLHADYVRERLALSAGPPVNINDIQTRVQLLLQDPSIRQLNVDLQPGPTQGEAVLAAKVTEAAPATLVATIANDEPPEVGSIRGTLSGTLRNLAGWGDTLALSYGRTQGANLGDIAWSVPVTAYDTAVTARYDYNGAGVVSDAFRGLDVFSRVQVAGVTIAQPLFKTPEHALTISLGADYTLDATYLLGQKFSFSQGAVNGETNSAAARLIVDWADHAPDQVIGLRTTVSQGLHIGATDAAGPPNANFTVFLGQARYVHTVFGASQIIARADVQLGTSALYPFEQIAIGGPSTVRGYAQNALVRDSGFITTLEGRIPVAALRVPYLSNDADDGAIQLAPFADYGGGWNHDATPAPRVIASIGMGVRWNVTSTIAAAVYYGYALRTHAANGNLTRHAISFNVTTQLY